MIAGGHRGAPATHKVVLLPLNLVEALPAELRKPSANVWKSIDEYLRTAGKETASLGRYESRDRWKMAEHKLKQSEEGVPGTDSVARQFIRQLHEDREFDAVVMTSLVYREARIFQGSNTAAWDGVERDFQIVNAPTMYGSIYLMTAAAGKMDGVSLHVYVFDGDGAKIFESFGGVDLVHKMDLNVPNVPGATPAKLVRRPLSDAVAVRAGIERAFDPYITPPASRSGGGG